MDMLQVLGLLLSCYGAYGVFAGQIYAKDGISARYVVKADEPAQFWVVCLSYIGVGLLIYVAVQHRFG